MSRAPFSVRQAWTQRPKLDDIAQLNATPFESRRVLAALPPRSDRDLFGLVLGAAAEMSAGRTMEAAVSLQAAHLAGIPLARLAELLAGVKLPHQVGTRSLDGMLPMKALLEAFKQAKATVRIQRMGGAFVGTGVLIDAGALLPREAGRLAVLTCAHVCCDEPGILPTDWPTPLLPQQAEIAFWDVDTKTTVAMCAVSDVLWRSEVGQWDASLLAIDHVPPGIEPVRVSPGEVQPDSRAYLLGFPQGNEMYLSPEGKVQGVADGYFSYALAARRGMSGGPLFGLADLQLVGIHRGERNEARQGVLLAALQQLARR